MRQRLYYIDNLRGFLIILVILGHCIQNLYTDFDHNIVFRYIYSFHMPLFMFISGFVSYKKEYAWQSLKRRFSQLIIPFISWAMVGMVVDGTFTLKWLTKPDDALWFLWVLFWIGVIFVSLSKLSKILNWPEEILMSICCTIFLGILLISKLSFGYHLVAWYLPFYSFGAITNKYEEKFDNVLNIFKWPLLIMFVFLGFFWMRTTPPTFINGNSMLITYVYKFITGIVGCFGIYIVTKSLNRKILFLSVMGEK